MQPNQSKAGAIPGGSNAQDPTKIRDMFAGIAGRYDLANHALSLGIDYHWRAVTAREVAACDPQRVLDLATGSGDLALAIRGKCPGADVVGADFCAPMLERAAAKGLRPLVVADGLALPFADAVFDVATIAFGLRNMSDRARCLSELARVLRPGGSVMVLDFSIPENPIMRMLYRIYLHTLLPLAAGVLTGKPDAYEYLGSSIEEFPSGEKMLKLMRSNGFSEARYRPLTGGIVTLYSGTAN